MQYIQFSRPTLWYQSLNDIIQPGYFIPAVKLRYSTQLIILKSYYSTPQQELRLGKSYSVHTSQTLHTSQTPLSLQASYSNLSLVLMRCSTWGRNSSVAVMKNWSDISLSLSLSVSHTYTHTHTHTHTCTHIHTTSVDYYAQMCISDAPNGCHTHQICDRCITEMHKIWALRI